MYSVTFAANFIKLILSHLQNIASLYKKPKIRVVDPRDVLLKNDAKYLISGQNISSNWMHILITKEIVIKQFKI